MKDNVGITEKIEFSLIVDKLDSISDSTEDIVNSICEYFDIPRDQLVIRFYSSEDEAIIIVVRFKRLCEAIGTFERIKFNKEYDGTPLRILIDKNIRARYELVKLKTCDIQAQQ